MSQDQSAQAQDEARPEPKTFTQEQVNGLLADQKRKVSASYQDYDDLKAKALRYDELEEANKSEVQKLRERAELAEQTAREHARARLYSDVSRETGVPLAALHGDDEEQVRATAAALLAWRDESRKSTAERSFLSFSSGASGAGSPLTGKGRAAEAVREFAQQKNHL